MSHDRVSLDPVGENTIHTFRFLAISYANAYGAFESDGVLGLSFDTINDNENIHFVDELYN